jgi:hypothetical protein
MLTRAEIKTIHKKFPFSHQTFEFAEALIEAHTTKLRTALEACVDYGSMTGPEWVMEKARAALGESDGSV